MDQTAHFSKIKYFVKKKKKKKKKTTINVDSIPQLFGVKHK